MPTAHHNADTANKRINPRHDGTARCVHARRVLCRLRRQERRQSNHAHLATLTPTVTIGIRPAGHHNNGKTQSEVLLWQLFTVDVCVCVFVCVCACARTREVLQGRRPIRPPQSPKRFRRRRRRHRRRHQIYACLRRYRRRFAAW